MIRPITCLCLLAAFFSGLYLYQAKHRTALLDRRISAIIHQTEAAQAETGLLRAQWAVLNEPDRLQGMADKYLQLKAMAPTQFVRLADLGTHLPPLLAPGETVGEAPVAAAAPDLVATTADPAPAAPAASPPRLLARAEPKIRPHAIPADGAADSPDPASDAPLQVTSDAPLHVTSDAPLHVRSDAPLHNTRLARGTKLPLAAPRPVTATVQSALARPMGMGRPDAVAAPVPYDAGPYVGSAIGSSSGGLHLPPPVPYDGAR